MLTHDELVAKKQARINEVHRMLPSRTALIVSDLQRSFMDPKSSLGVASAWELVPSIRKMIDFCRNSGILVIFTEFIASPLVPTLRGDPFGPEHLPAVPEQPTGWGYPSSNSNVGTQGPEDTTTIIEL